MYSVVLMAALSANGPDAVAFGKHRGGGCWGVAYGVYGGGCGGWRHSHSCCGCFGGTACFGGCYGSCMGCYGGCYGAPQWYGPSMPYHDAGNPVVPSATPSKPAEGMPAPGAAPAGAPRPGGAAKLILDVPANAKLFVDDLPMTGKEVTRQFATPVLEPGQTYYYTVRVESNRDGKPVSETRRVLVRAGELVRESFNADSRTDVVRAGR